MRPLKFRAYDLDKKEMFDVYQIQFQDNGITVRKRGSLHKSENAPKNVVLMLSSRFHDKHGKEVYADDNIGSPDRAFVARVFQVEGGKDHGQWCCQHKDGDIQTLYDALYGDGFEVIGDIFEGGE